MDVVIFNSPTDGDLILDQIIGKIVAICGDQNYQYSIMIGTDSRVHPEGVEFVTAIVVHKKFKGVGKGARYFTLSKKINRKFSLQERMYQEATFSIEMAQLLIDNNLLDMIGLRDIFEIHIDVGQNGPTREVIRGVVGMVIGCGFVCKIKPEAVAASSAADRHT